MPTKRTIVRSARNVKRVRIWRIRSRQSRTQSYRSTIGAAGPETCWQMLPASHFQTFPPPWSDVPPTHRDKLEVAKASQQKHLQQIKVRHANAWINSWKTYQNRVMEPSIAQAAPLDRKRLKVQSLLKKAESALATQIRTGKIGLADFLHKRRVPGVTSPACSCGWHRQTPEHVIMFCRLISGRKAMLRAVGTNSYQALTESPKPLKTLTAWLMKSGMLTQFSLAVQLLYQQ